MPKISGPYPIVLFSCVAADRYALEPLEYIHINTNGDRKISKSELSALMKCSVSEAEIEGVMKEVETAKLPVHVIPTLADSAFLLSNL